MSHTGRGERETPHCKVYETKNCSVSTGNSDLKTLQGPSLKKQKNEVLGSSDMPKEVQKRIHSFPPCKHCSSLPNTGSHFGVECFVILLYISVVNRVESYFPTD